MKQDSEKFISVKELSDILGVSRVTVFRKIKSGEIEAQRVGRSFAIPVKSLPFLSKKELDSKTKSQIQKSVGDTVSSFESALRRLGGE